MKTATKKPKTKKPKDDWPLAKMSKTDLLEYAKTKHKVTLDGRKLAPQIRNTIEAIEAGRIADIPDEHFVGGNPAKSKAAKEPAVQESKALDAEAAKLQAKVDQKAKTFLKVSTKTTVKSYVREQSTLKVKCELGCSPRHQTALDVLIDRQEPVMVTIEQIQGSLPGTE